MLALTGAVGLVLLVALLPANLPHVDEISISLTLSAAGVALGLAGAALSTRLLQGWLFGVTPLDPATFAGSAAGLLAVTLLAQLHPRPPRRARRPPCRTPRGVPPRVHVPGSRRLPES